MAQTDDLAYEVERLREDYERLANYARSLEIEMDRRTDWTLGSIWNVDLNLGLGALAAAIIYAISQLEGDAWWHLVLGGCAFLLGERWLTKRRKRLEESDRKRVRWGNQVGRL